MQDKPQQFDGKQEYAHQDELFGLEGRPLNPLSQTPLLRDADSGPSTSGRGHSEGIEEGVHHGPQWGLLTLSQPITASEVGHRCFRDYCFVFCISDASFDSTLSLLMC